MNITAKQTHFLTIQPRRMFIIILIVSLCQVARSVSMKIPVTVSSSTLTPEAGSKVQFTCNYTMYTLDEGGTTVTVRWYFGQDLEDGARIVAWYYQDPENVHYGEGYNASNYEMSISEIKSGYSMLTINKVTSRDEGSIGCDLIQNGLSGNAFVTIQVLPARSTGMIPLTVTSTNLTPEEGSRVQFTCNFTVSDGDELYNLVWYFGQEIVKASRIVDWRFNDENNVHYGDGYDASNYEMSISDITSGHSVLTIYKVTSRDEGSIGCNPVRRSSGTGYEYVTIQVLHTSITPGTGILSTSATNSSSFSPVFPTSYNTTESNREDLTVIHVGNDVVVIRWITSRANDIVTRYGIFYKPDASDFDSSVLFVEGDENVATITNLAPNTLYHIKVDAYTEDGTFFHVGDIDVTTLSLNAGDSSVTLFIGIAAAVFIGSFIVVVVIVCAVCLTNARRRTFSKDTTNNEYEQPQEETEYQELQTISHHTYQKITTPLPLLPANTRNQNLQKADTYEEVLEPETKAGHQTTSKTSAYSNIENHNVPRSQNAEYLDLDMNQVERPAPYQSLSTTAGGISDQRSRQMSEVKDQMYQDLDKKTMDPPKNYEQLSIPSNEP